MPSECVLGYLDVGFVPRRGAEWMRDGRSGTQQGGCVPQTRGPPSSDPRAFAKLCPLKVTREIPTWVPNPSVPAGSGMQLLRGSPVFRPRGPQAALVCGRVSAESHRPLFLRVSVSFPFFVFYALRKPHVLIRRERLF